MSSIEKLGIIFIIGMFAIYPVSLLAIEYMLGRTFHGTWNMFFISLSGIMAVLLSPKKVPTIKFSNIALKISTTSSVTRPKRKILFWLVISFTIFSVMFSNFGWHDDRQSIGSTLSAICRALWLLLAISVIPTSEKIKLIYLGMTLILAAIDESRTYFLIAFLIVASNSKYSKYFFVLGFIALMSIAALRMNESTNIFQSIIYGITGETINATHAYRQLSLVNIDNDIAIYHFLLLIFSSLFSIIVLIMDSIFGAGNLSLVIPAELVNQQLLETLNPMGGWYIANDMILFGPFSYFVCFLFVFINYNIARMLLNQLFPLGTYFFILFPKTNVILFWNIILYFLVIYFFILIISPKKT